MIIRCTKKLLAELKRRPIPEESEGDTFWSRHANVFRIERRKCVLITNDTTLFAMFIPALFSDTASVTLYSAVKVVRKRFFHKI